MARTHFKKNHYVRVADGYYVSEDKYVYFVVVANYPEWHTTAKQVDAKLADPELLYRELSLLGRKELQTKGKK